MSQTGTENFVEPFTFYWFDYVATGLLRSYADRMQDMRSYIADYPGILTHPQATIIPLFPESISTVAELVAYEKIQLAANFEGVMIRSPLGRYKTGRSTAKEGILLKLKQFSDGEAVILEAEELQHNENKKTKNELGDSKRSTKKDGLVNGGTLGSFKVRGMSSSPFHDVTFNIGTGFTAQMRTDFWNTRESLVGKIVKFKYFEKGGKNAPRFPVFLGFRDPDDM
ncbi:hypothetical protein HDU87_001732 [Geranomyces variabilis]|uniref:DNA ligase OB-like domain-containing protein n=1 Tax=Geranomyces variabilis TaxID=109894 RepID=A0AAD5TAV9_9FUNG|nr:hypothetical protein HDU87_001732 [Geranomyces variabilis]